MKTLMTICFILGVLFITGCQEPSSAKIKLNDVNIPSIDPNGCNMFTGKAADIITEQLADNMKTKQAMISDIFKRSGSLFVWLIMAMVGGFAFWGFTRSKYGWVIPASCIGGIVTILFFVNYSEWIFTVVLIISGLILIWKAYEYQSERNAEKEKHV